MQAPCSIAEQHVCPSRLRSGHRVIYDRSGIRALLSADHVHSGTVRPFLELLPCCRAECICGRKDHLLVLGTQLACKLPDRGRLSDSVYTDHKHDGSPVLELISGLSHVHLLLDAVDQKLTALRRLLDMLCLYLLLEVVQDIHRCPYSQISHDQRLFQFIVELVVDL